VSDFTRTAVLLDRHPMWLEAVEAVLERVGVYVIGKAATPDEALALVTDKKPDLLVAELGPDDEAGGTGWLRLVREQAPGVRCLVLSTSGDAHTIEAVLAAGAVAYVLKSAHPDDLASAVRQSFEHSVFLARGSTTVVAPPRIARHTDAAADLTNREREILRLVAEGHSNAQLARMLWVTEQTVKFHLSNVYRKLSVSNRTEAARWAQLHGLLPTGSELTAA
jgi:DNA-binding NarL/FixJ family response regulator